MNKWTNEQWKTDDNDVHIGDIIWLSYVREVSEDRDDVVGEILEECSRNILNLDAASFSQSVMLAQYHCTIWLLFNPSNLRGMSYWLLLS